MEEYKKIESKVKKDGNVSKSTFKTNNRQTEGGDLKNVYANATKTYGIMLSSSFIQEPKQDFKFRALLEAMNINAEFVLSKQTLPKIYELKKQAANFLSLTKHLKRKKEEYN